MTAPWGKAVNCYGLPTVRWAAILLLAGGRILKSLNEQPSLIGAA
ncbi:unnamed protein product, partial [marine sediment metagenome]